ncbi:DUF2637 domain-containing protein [Kitasatospora mediocidica]|uniref:DUF2637 domain-containing protein n=1 Tax=Kitasatospora mediocidica TaxID=58352 RepID=UPI000565D428|nr:DUF2637 domain-containing protein [Kitasatospora mediocidica]
MTKNNDGTDKLTRGALILVMGAALTVGTWSIYTLLTTHFHAPRIVALFGAGMFDLAAFFFARLAQRYAASPDSGLVPRLAMLAMVTASSWVNWTHAHMEHWGTVGAVILAAAPVIAELAFEMWHRYEHREALRRQGRVAEALPVIPGLAWLLFAPTSWRVMRASVGSRLSVIEDEAMRITASVGDAHREALDAAPARAAVASVADDAQHIVITLQQPRAITAAPADTYRQTANDAPGEAARQRSDAPPRIITVPQPATADAGPAEATVSLGEVDFASLSKAAAIKAMRDALPDATAPQISDALASHGITADAAYVRTVLSRAAKTPPQGTGGYL